MANSITLVKQFVAMLDEVYKVASLTSDLTAQQSLSEPGQTQMSL